jgi:hypothetical protein
MAAMYCALCQRPVEARRDIGIGTVVAAFFTAGITLLALPFYRKRCPICRGSAVVPLGPDGSLPGGLAPARRVVDLEKQLAAAQEAVEVLETELHHVRSERDFYKQLRAPADRQGGGASG